MSPNTLKDVDADVTSLTAWAAEKSQEIDAERAEQMKEKGVVPFLKLPEGESRVKFLPKQPEESKGQFGTRYIFTVEYDGATYKYAISPRSPLFRAVIHNLAYGITDMIIVRAGTGKTTKYSVLTPNN